MEDGALFCEKCGTKVNGGSRSGATQNSVPGSAYRPSNGSVKVNSTAPGGNSGTADMTDVMKRYFKDPIGTIRQCADKDYSIYGMIFLGCKDLFIALLFAVFKDLIGGYVTGLFWIYNISGPLAFFIMFIMLLVGDAAWIGMSIGVRKVVNNSYDPKWMIGTVALGQIYLPAIVLIGIMILAGLKYNGGNVVILAGIVTMSFMQYECVMAKVKDAERTKVLYGMALAAFVYAIIWIGMLAIAGNAYSYYGFY